MSTRSVNKVILVGNVGKDPEIKYTPSGKCVAKLSLATNERYKDRNGEWQDRTEWHNLVLWQRLAEIVGEYVSKGSRLYSEGKLQTSSWDDKQSGEKKYRTEIIVDDLVLLGNGHANGNGNSGAEGNGHAPATSARTSPQAQPRQVQSPEIQPPPRQPYEEAGITEDDIPF